MEKSADNVKKREDENAAVGGMREDDEKELPQNEGKKITKEKTSTANTKGHASSYKTLVTNMEELRMNLENHLHLPYGENSADKTNKNLQDLKGKAQVKNKKNFKEDYLLSFEQLATNAKILTDNEINEFEEILKQNAFNAEAERNISNENENNVSSAANYSSKVNSDDNESGVQLNIEDLLKQNQKLENNEDKETDDMETEPMNTIEQLEQMGYGFLNLNEEAELPTEYDQGAMRKYLKNIHNSLIKNKNMTDKDKSSKY